MTMPDCLFCKIIDKKIPAKIVYEDEKTAVFQDINPQAPVHVLIIPKKHVESLSALKDGDTDLIGSVIQTARKVAADKKWKDYRLVFNNGLEAGQTVFHIHAHLLSGRQMTWPPG